MTEQQPREFSPRLTQLFADAGVAFVVVPELPKTGGQWRPPAGLTDRKALIQLNLRYKWQDIFWFTLFHEVCHILEHRNQRIIIDGIDKNGPLEDEAKPVGCRRFLCRGDAWSGFLPRGRRSTRAASSRFAHQIGIAPGIVVGTPAARAAPEVFGNDRSQGPFSDG